MKLLFTNDAFTHYGVNMPGVPVLIDDEMHIAEGPQRWLFYVALETRPNPQSSDMAELRRSALRLAPDVPGQRLGLG
jgi:hypothetical protein